MPVPAPPSGTLAVKYFDWDEQRPITRICAAARQPNSFNTGPHAGRFRPFNAGQPDPVPTLYGANHVDGALGETIFHDVPPGTAPWTVARATLYGRLRTILVPQRKLRLVDLTGWAHKALKIEGSALVACDPVEYPVTAQWAERFHELPTRPDGLYWRSRQYDRVFALMLFGDRVHERELRVIFDETIPLWQGDGLGEVLVAAERANVTITV